MFLAPRNLNEAPLGVVLVSFTKQVNKVNSGSLLVGIQQHEVVGHAMTLRRGNDRSKRQNTPRRAGLAPVANASKLNMTEPSLSAMRPRISAAGKRR